MLCFKKVPLPLKKQGIPRWSSGWDSVFNGEGPGSIPNQGTKICKTLGTTKKININKSMLRFVLTVT